MNQMKMIANEMLPVYENEYQEKFVNARELHDQMMVGKDFSTWIKNRIENYGFIEGEDFSPISVKSEYGRPKIDYLLTLDTGKEIAMVENNELGRAIRKYFIEVEKKHRKQQPQSIEDLIIMQAQSLKQVREDQEQLKKENKVITHRLDNIDRIDAIGDLQQRLNGMVKRYAQQEGLTFAKAWGEFRTAYNTAFHTNLKAKLNHYKNCHGLKSLTMPQYLSLTDSLEDAIRVADKMLNEIKKA
ncbi:antA/AntB antirepressor family protein [Halobacillus ihumii]|uniref:antA/AntB antirepressor family protein n=1 Tax=Halobacillus ihumii TaxID=2686092 RepID=UPI001F0784F4|nr:antA/AntB antirepressor family protein [Halobacillus ihumii]